ncbi:tartrate dehydrogenase [Metabacillus arenae]|uniref:D-malate dehydrogenase (decarboxylating) n=1 Tax=Metabacillus arenae TaxID=2771434 RepID=A0A926NI66_9BACI|nr:tartrate dehydrogenase [Metabacillus arenae]MBD1381505.1 tartrate dehydrogenase [Metabacillus arenae]
MKPMKIAILPGDGIGPEVMNEALKILRVLQDQDVSFQTTINILPWNSEYYLENGRMMPENGLAILSDYDAILFGAIGDERVPDPITIWELIMPIRKKFKQYVNLRPVKNLNGIQTPLFNQDQHIDFVIIRENAEGEYSNSGGRLYEGTQDELAVQNTIITRKGTEKIAKYAFEYARKTAGRKVTSATKSNAVIHSMKLWDEVVAGVAKEYPDIQLEKNYIDALSAYFVQRPDTFDVVVASNLFGDILSDLGSALVGGLGLSPSANINPEKEYPSMFEPVHGSAPNIAGTGKANPIAQIWSTALMVEHLGREDLATLIVNSIEDVLSEGEVLTPDLGGNGSTFQLGDAISNKLSERMEKNSEEGLHESKR